MAQDDKKNAAATNSKESVAEDPSKGKSKKRLIILLSVVVGVVAAQLLTALLFVHWVKKEDPAVEALRKIEQDEKAKMEMMTKVGTVLAAPITTTVNLTGGEHYLKSAIQFEWDGVKYLTLSQSLTDRQAKIQDIIINILSSQSMADLMSTSGKQRVRDAIRSEVNAIIPAADGTIENVFFQEFLIQ